MPRAIKPAQEVLSSIELVEEVDSPASEAVAVDGPPPPPARVAGFEGATSEPAAIIEPLPPAPAPERKEWTFVKNIHVGERLRLPGGKVFVFPSSSFRTTERELAEQIIAISSRHKICLQ